MRRLAVIFLTIGTIRSQVAAQPPRDSVPPAETKMTTYYLVLLKRGPTWTATNDSTASRIFRGHMATINRLGRTGQMAVAGPLKDAGDIEGIFVLHVASLEEAKTAVATDPAIHSGRLTPVFYEWYAPRGLRTDLWTTPSPP